MSERSATTEETVRLGLLLEQAQAQQQGAAESLDHLQSLVQGLDDVVRDEIRRTLIEELQGLDAEVTASIAGLRRLRRTVSLRAVAWSIGAAVVVPLLCGATLQAVRPSIRRIDHLQAQQAALEQNLAALRAAGGVVVLRRCGHSRRWCVRVDRRAPRYGRHGDFAIVAGG
ncbi:MAG: hypothetical protein KGL36_11680 [Gammaproteobacteria bacterium]|nr:hypothetical protein [Gammaproteobacteria bacterium]